MSTITWRKEIESALRDLGDTFISTTLSDEEMDREFDDGFGGTEGAAFTAWGEKYVYFPICYDGAEWVGSAPRDPCDEATNHMGGG